MDVPITKSTHPVRRQRSAGGGFSLVEAIIGVILAGGLMVVAVRVVGAAKALEARNVGRMGGQELGRALLAEILAKPYWDPQSGGGLGPESGEGTTGDRSLFDDLDDFDQWTASPPQYSDGTNIPGLDRWRRTVEVVWLDPADLDVGKVSETGIKHITVTVTQDDVTRCRIEEVSTNQ